MRITAASVLLALALASPVSAQVNDLCDIAYERCRPPLIALMDAEQVGIDFFSWFSEDYRFIHALNRAKSRGVRVRFIGNDRWSGPRHTFMEGLRTFQIPARVALPTPSHIKAVVFAGQHKLFFTGSNFTGSGLNYIIPYVNYADETIITTSDVSLVRTFLRLFDDYWVDATKTRDYSGKLDRIRRYPVYPIDPRVEIGPGSVTEQNKRAAAAIDRENVGIDIIMYRLNDTYTRAAIIRALRRGVPVRLITEGAEINRYRGMASYIHDVVNAGAKLKVRLHQGITHEKFALLHGQSLTIIPSNNWDVWAARSATLYLDSDDVYRWSAYHFSRKWNSPTEFKWW